MGIILFIVIALSIALWNFKRAVKRGILDPFNPPNPNED